MELSLASTHKGWFDFKLTNTTTSEFFFYEERDLVEKLLLLSSSSHISDFPSSGKFYRISLHRHDVNRKFYFDEDGEATEEDETFSVIGIPHFFIPYNNDDHQQDNVQIEVIRNNLTRMFANDEIIRPEALAALTPVLAWFSSGITPITIDDGSTIIRPFVLHAKFVEMQYYDRDGNEVELMEFKRLKSSPEEIMGNISKVRYENSSRKSESCIICFEEFKIGLDISQLPCSHIYHERCIRQWLTQKNNCPTCRYELL